MITFESKGDFKNTEKFLNYIHRGKMYSNLAQYGEMGKNALSAATPTETGLAASSWDYEIDQNGSGCTITWTNSDIENGFNVIIGLQYGHGTGTGGWVAGRDFINPAIRPVFDQIADAVWKEVTSA